MTPQAAFLHIGSTADITHWLRTGALEIVLIAVGAVLLSRLFTWLGGLITERIDKRFRGSDDLVRTEASKHNHAMTQVITYVSIGVMYALAILAIIERFGVPVRNLVAPATVLGAGLGFGAQRIVQDFLAGFFIITERQYGYGDVVSIAVTGSSDNAEGTVEDVTLRYTRLRNADGEVITVPNGQIVQASNLSRDWARSVIDVPVPPNADIARVQELLISVGRKAYHDPTLRPYLLDTPTVMGIEGLAMDAVQMQMVARTLPGKQFEVGRHLRARIVEAFGRHGIVMPVVTEPETATEDVPLPDEEPDHGPDVEPEELQEGAR